MEMLFTTRLFSLREANTLVPMLQRTFVHARGLREELNRIQAQLATAGHPSPPADIEVDPAAPPAVRVLQTRGKELAQSMLLSLHEVAQLGIEVKAPDGLCDLRSRHAGRIVYLCWRFGEERITHFHELHTGFSGRKPLPENGEFAGELLH